MNRKLKKQMLERVGNFCRNKRLQKGFMQIDIAVKTGYSIETISKFEQGFNDNSLIFMGYIEMCDIYELKELSTLIDFNEVN